MDSRATGHIAYNQHLFSSYTLYANPLQISIANGVHIGILRFGTITISPIAPLQSMLNVLEAVFNIVSISKLIRQQNCSVSFSPNHFVIQDFMTKHVFGKGYESGVITTLIISNHVQPLVLVVHLYLKYIVLWVMCLCQL